MGHSKKNHILLAFLLAASGTACAAETQAEPVAEIGYVIHVSVDGLRSDAVTHLGPGNLPNFYRLRVMGAFTDNARTDYDFTNTLPNHTCQLTGRPVLGPDGHGVSFNDDPGTTLEVVNGYYIAGVFDVVHDHGLFTAMYASKPKFDFLERSWNGDNGAPDLIGEDNGADKIDIYVNTGDTHALVDSFIAHLEISLHEYSFIHFVDPDAVGHDYGWESATYYRSVMKMDTLIGSILDAVEEDDRYAGATAILVTADHGGTGTSHSDPTVPENYTVPFYVMAPAVPAGADLYWLNPSSRLDPGTGRPDYSAVPQPIRNGGVTNLALDLLSLPQIPGSVINGAQDLDVMLPGGDSALPSVSIESPSLGEIFESPASIEISASVGGGTISNVEFFADYAKIGEDGVAPYEVSWIDPLPGDHTITARAVKEDGAAAAASIGISIIASTSEEILTGSNDIIIYPNPFRRSTMVRFSLRAPGHVEMTVFDVLGREVGTAVKGLWEAGAYLTVFDASRISPGCYFYSARLGDEVRTGKMMILR